MWPKFSGAKRAKTSYNSGGESFRKKEKEKKKKWGIQAQTETNFWFHYFEVQLFEQRAFNFVIIGTFLGNNPKRD